MQFLEYKSHQLGRYAEDVRRMRAILVNAGYMATEIDIYTLWDDYSRNCLCSWKMLPDDDQQLLTILLCGFGVGPAPAEDSVPRFWPDPASEN